MVLNIKFQNRTIRRCLNKSKYYYLQCRKKGLLSRGDLKRRLAFARKVKRLLPSEFWKDGVAFYLDGVSWAHKTNPCEQARSSRTRTWRQKGEGLSIHCTAKGRKEGSGGSMVKLMVAIAYDKGVIKCQQYYGNINGEIFSNFIKKEFPEMFAKTGKSMLFLQDGDPSQNSAAANTAMDSIGCRLFKIPPRSPRLEPY